MTGEELWTLEQLSDRVADALAVDYDGAPNGRVREVPNARTIRWYTTIGLVDRPAATRGRMAMYGRRHLLQLVAVKRLQAAGRPLAEIQAELLGSTEAALERIARLPEQSPVRARFWAQAPAAATDNATDDADSVTPATVTPVHGIRLAGGVTVLLGRVGRAPNADELAAIEAAAGPLLDLLSRLGLEERETP